jgi:hypothetical protein
MIDDHAKFLLEHYDPANPPPFSSLTAEARREWYDVFLYLQGNVCGICKR